MIPNPDTHAYDAYMDALCASAEADLERLLLRRQVRTNWHDNLPGEPLCGADEWRTRDRRKVIKIRDMDDGHLSHCIRFAQTKRHHRFKLKALTLEEDRRKREGGYALPEMEPKS